MAENCKVIKREVLYVQVQVTSPLLSLIHI